MFGEFTTASGSPNVSIFSNEVAALALSEQPDSVAPDGTSVVLQWNALPTAADLALIDTAVAAHSGDAFSEELQSATEEAEATTTDTAETVRVSLATGKLPAGDYQIVWSCELSVEAVVANTGAQANLYFTKNGGSRVPVGQGINDQAVYDTRGAMAYLEDVKAGDEYLLELGYRKVGVAAQTAKIKSARVYLKPLSA